MKNLKNMKNLNNMNKIKVGFPRALLYYEFFPLWETFFNKIGAKIIISPKTNKQIKDIAVRTSPDEDCYNSKLYYGHTMALKDKVDYLFIPRFGSKHNFFIGCPKFISLAEVIHSMHPNLPEILMPYYSKANAGHGILRLIHIAFSIGFKFTKNPITILKALFMGLSAQKKHEKNLHLSIENLEKWKRSEISLNEKPKILDKKSTEKPLKIALAGHRYMLNDHYASLEIEKKLINFGCEIIKSEQIPKKIIDKELEILDYPFYFEHEREILGTILYFLSNRTDRIDGIVHIITFSCGPDSLAGEIAAIFSKRKPEVPLLQLVFDELTGEAGLNTRLEAFTDMLRIKKNKNEKKKRSGKKPQSVTLTLAA